MNLFRFEQIEPILRGKGKTPLTPARVMELLREQGIWFGLDSSKRPWTHSSALEQAAKPSTSQQQASDKPITDQIQFQ